MWLSCGVQGVAESYSVRVTFFSGDVHVGAFGCFQAHPKQPIRVADPKFMLQVGGRQHDNMSLHAQFSTVSVSTLESPKP